MNLIVNHFPYKTFNDYDLHECEQAILSDPNVTPIFKPSKYLIIYKIAARILSYFNINHIRSTPDKLLVNPLLDSNHIITLLLGPDYLKYLPYSYFKNSNRSIYLFDAWPVHHNSFISFLNNNKIDHLFVHSSKLAQRFQAVLNSTNVNWIPEAIDPSCYVFSNSKSIDVLSFGRKYDKYHNIILPYLTKNNKVYHFEKVKGEVIFEKRSDFIDALGNSKISICFPSNITHPDRAGDLEIMTMRYLQSIVSKCLIIGKAPEEMVHLFGYNPVIEINWDDPLGQLDFILENLDQYHELIEKNYDTVLNNHTWHHRWDLIKQLLNSKSK